MNIEWRFYWFVLYSKTLANLLQTQEFLSQEVQDIVNYSGLQN